MTKKENSLLYLEPEDNKMIKQVAWRSMIGSGTYNYENMQALVFLYAMIPVINRYYDKEEDRIKAYKRHLSIFNITPALYGLVTGLAASMEKTASEDPDNYDYSAIQSVKSSLMGPLSGIGDSIFWGSLKVIATGIGVSYALQGSILGPLLYFLINFVPQLLCKLWLPRISFKMGTGFLSKMGKDGLMPLITKCFNIVGLMTIGAMSTTMVKLSIPLELAMGDTVLKIQEVIDGLMPSLLPVALVLICFKYLKKEVKPMTLILILIVVGIVGRFFGIL